MTRKFFPHYWSFVWGIHWSTEVSLHKEPVIQTFDVSFVVSLSRLFNKQLSCQWCEMPWRSCHCNVWLILWAFNWKHNPCVCSSGSWAQELSWCQLCHNDKVGIMIAHGFQQPFHQQCMIGSILEKINHIIMNPDCIIVINKRTISLPTVMEIMLMVLLDCFVFDGC